MITYVLKDESIMFFSIVFDGRPRSKEAVTSAAGAVAGEPTNDGIK